MSDEVELGDDGRVLTLRLPLASRRRGGRKLVVVPEGAPAWTAPRARIDSTLVKALARAHRWKRLPEGGEYASIADLAAAERINTSYLCRVLWLTLLASAIVEAILDGTQSVEVTLDRMMRPFPVD